MSKLIKIIIIFLGIYFSISNVLLFAEENSNIQFYQDGIGKIELTPMPSSVEYKINLIGSSKYKKLYFQINKVDENNNILNQREVKLNDHASFNYYYYFKDGLGKYLINIFGSNNNSERFVGLCYFNITVTQNLPFNITDMALNKNIIEYVDTVMGKTVDSGECWDLAQEALDRNSADWKRTTDFGIPVNPDKDEILPGDIIQMQNVVLKYTNRIEYYGNPQHTAIVYEVIKPNNYIIANQNIYGKRYVIKINFNLEHYTSGTYQFYRPIAGLTKINR